MNNDNRPKITQINSNTPLTDEEKNIINEYKTINEENLSKTQKFQLLNKKNNSKNQSLELPKKKDNLSNTIKLKISDLRKEIDKSNINTDIYDNKKKSLYDTIIIKLDDLINKKNAIKAIESKKVSKIEKPQVNKKKFHLFKPRNITKMKDFKLNVDSEEFGRQLYNLNKIALNNLSNTKNKKVRRYSNLSKLEKINKIHISESNYKSYQHKMNSFAINKLYYKFAPKETKKYKIYKYSVIASFIMIIVSVSILLNWFSESNKVKTLSNALNNQVEVEYIEGGDIINITPPPSNLPGNNTEAEISTNNEKNLYWRYLNTPLASVNFKNIKSINPDTVGWLIVNNTNINYPVVQTTDNDYYLKHSFDNSFNYAGWVFADFRDTFNPLTSNSVIYAHGRKDGIMFGTLMNALDKSWYTNTENQLIQFSTPEYDSLWQIFSIYTIEAESYYITTDFSNPESFMNFAKTMKERSIYDFNIDIESDDKLLTLSTCYNDSGMRTVVQAKLVKIQNKTD